MLDEISIVRLFAHNLEYFKKTQRYLVSDIFGNEDVSFLIDKIHGLRNKNLELKQLTIPILNEIDSIEDKTKFTTMLDEVNAPLYIDVDIDSYYNQTLEWIKHQKMYITIGSLLEDWESVKSRTKEEFNYEKALGDIKKLVTPYRKASVDTTKSMKS
jgi:hypothetical protein